MKTSKSLAAFLILAVSTLIFIGWHSPEINPDKGADQHAIVLLEFEAQPEKGALAVSELTKLLEQVKEEPHFVSIKLHVNPNDNTNILLYEEWEDADYYKNEHMNTAHLKAFMDESLSFLKGPPEVTFWKVESVFE